MRLIRSSLHDTRSRLASLMLPVVHIIGIMSYEPVLKACWGAKRPSLKGLQPHSGWAMQGGETAHSMRALRLAWHAIRLKGNQRLASRSEPVTEPLLAVLSRHKHRLVAADEGSRPLPSAQEVRGMAGRLEGGGCAEGDSPALQGAALGHVLQTRQHLAMLHRPTSRQDPVKAELRHDSIWPCPANIHRDLAPPPCMETGPGKLELR